MGSLKTNFLHGKKIQKLSGEDEDIKMVGMYSNPLFSLQLGKCSLHHASVSFKTKHIWDLVVNLKNYKVHLDSDLNRHKGPVRKYYNRIKHPVGLMAPNTKDTTVQYNLHLSEHHAINYTSAYCPLNVK